MTVMKLSATIARIKSIGRCKDGIAAVEFVLILPVLMIMLFGTIDIGRLLMDYQLVSKSVRDAARFVARSDGVVLGLRASGGATPAPLDCASFDDTSLPVDQAKNLALTGMVDGDPSADPLLGYWTDPSTIEVTADCGDNSTGIYSGIYAGEQKIPAVTVGARVTVPLLNGWLMGRGASLTFRVQHQEIFIGQ